MPDLVAREDVPALGAEPRAGQVAGCDRRRQRCRRRWLRILADDFEPAREFRRTDPLPAAFTATLRRDRCVKLIRREVAVFADGTFHISLQILAHAPCRGHASAAAR